MSQNSCQNLALVGWAVGVWGGWFWGGGCAAVWRAGGGGGLVWRLLGVAARLVCCLWCFLLCILTKCFFRVCLLCFFLLPSPLRWVLSASLLASLASSRFLSVWFALHRRAAVFGPVFWSVFPHSGKVFLQSKKVRWSFALFLGFHFWALLASAFFFRSGLLCNAQLRFPEWSFGPNSHSVGINSGKARRFVGYEKST